MKKISFPLLLPGLFFLLINTCTNNTASLKNNKKETGSTKSELDVKETKKLSGYIAEAGSFCIKNQYNTAVCFLIDMSLPSGKNRFFVCDMKSNSVIFSALVAHGSCNTIFAKNAIFSNQVGCGCSAAGKYKINTKYTGRFGTAYKLYGLDSSNNNAFERHIVLHGYSQVPANETAPLPICNSLGCPMVAPVFMKKLSEKIDGSAKPVLLWIFN